MATWFMLARAMRLARPMPPQPMVAMLTRSLAEMRRVRPYEPDGSMVKAAAVAAPALMNCLRGRTFSFRMIGFRGWSGGESGAQILCQEGGDFFEHEDPVLIGPIRVTFSFELDEFDFA